MRKIFYLGFCLVLAAGIGCAITDYQLITDNDQKHNNNQANFTVNTNGKAHIRSFTVGIIWSDGPWTNDLYFVDQKSNGNRTMQKYSLVTTAERFYAGEAGVHDDLYCNPDWVGCSGGTSTDPPGGYDRVGAGFAAFDFDVNVPCSFASGNQARTEYFNPDRLIATLRQRRGNYNDGECGRESPEGLTRYLNFINQGQMGTWNGEVGLWYFLDNTNVTKMVDGTLIPYASKKFFVQPRGRVGFLWYDNPLIANELNAMDSVIPGDSEHEVTVIFNGMSHTKRMKFAGAPGRTAKTRF
jgi:hypothetical protein